MTLASEWSTLPMATSIMRADLERRDTPKNGPSLDRGVGSVTPVSASRRGNVWLWIAGVAFLFVLLLALFFVNPLPGDEEMIAHFNKHRDELETLVERYREHDTSDREHLWSQLPEIVQLRSRAGIERVAESGTIWLPEPYSAESARQLKDLAATNGVRYITLMRRYGSLKIELEDPRFGMRPAIVRTAIASAIWKEYFFFPHAPKLERGRLWWPASVDGKLTRSERVFGTLNQYPPGWERGECVFRSIQPQWFIRMCWGA